jgi:hypothetical protein
MGSPEGGSEYVVIARRKPLPGVTRRHCPTLVGGHPPPNSRALADWPDGLERELRHNEAGVDTRPRKYHHETAHTCVRERSGSEGLRHQDRPWGRFSSM